MYIEFNDFSKCFLRLARNSDVLESNGSQIRLPSLANWLNGSFTLYLEAIVKLS